MVNAPFLLLVVALSATVAGWAYPGDLPGSPIRVYYPTVGLLVVLFLGNFVQYVFIFSLFLTAITGWGIGYSLARVDINTPTVRKPRLSTACFLGLMVIVLLLGLYVRWNQLGDYGLRLDERFHYRTALGYLRSGHFNQWNFSTSSPGSSYHRAFLYTWQVAQSFELFGVSLWAGRLVSLFWGMLLAVPLYWVGFRLGLNRYWLLALLLSVMLSPYAITTSRWLRLYSMFSVLFALCTVILYELLSATRWVNRLQWGVFLIPVGLMAVETHLLTLTLVISVFLFLLVENISSFGDFDAASEPFGVTISIVLASGAVIGLIFTGGTIYQEINEGIRVSLMYSTTLYGDLFGYSAGALIFPLVIFTGLRKPFERYLWWVILPPVLILMFATDRFYQFRYAGHLALLTLPMFYLAAQRIVNCALESGETIVATVLAVVFLAAPLKNLPYRLTYIRDGNMGYVGFRGVQSPHYRDFLKTITPLLDSNHQVLTLHFYGKYIADLRQTGALVQSISSPTREAVMSAVEDPTGTGSPFHQWLILPDHARNSFSDNFFRDLDQKFNDLDVPNYWQLSVYYRRTGTVPGDPDRTGAPIHQTEGDPP